MSQSRLDSALEAIINILIGAGFAFAAQLLWFPAIGKEFTLGDNLMTTAVFTVVSFVRSYLIRRFMNGRSFVSLLKFNGK